MSKKQFQLPQNLIAGISVESISQQISEIENLNLEKVSVDSVKDRMKKLSTGIINVRFGVTSRNLFRGRIGEWSSVDDLWYRPSEELKDYGRLNRPGCSRFYSCPDIDTVISELQPKQGVLISVLECHSIDPKKNLQCAALGYHSVLLEASSNHGFRKSLRRFFSSTKSALKTDENREKNHLIHEFLHTILH